jgi:hypothetical protein
LWQGSRSIQKGSHNEEKLNASKNYRNVERNDVEDMRELSSHEEIDRWAR